MDDLISRQAAIAVADSSDYVGLSVEDCKKVTDEVVKGLIQLPSAQPLTEEDYTELHDRFGTWVEEVVRDMISGEGKRWGNERRLNQQTGGNRCNQPYLPGRYRIRLHPVGQGGC